MPEPEYVYIVIAYTGNSAECDGADIYGVYKQSDLAEQSASVLRSKPEYMAERTWIEIEVEKRVVQ